MNQYFTTARYGYRVGHLDIQSHIQNATGQAAINRKKFKMTVMNGVGWKSHEKEWWHFELPQAGQSESQDIPYDVSL